MNIFNSLGSNYTFAFALKTLLSWPGAQASAQLKKLLAKKYDGEVLLTYKGRDAITLALRAAAGAKKLIPEDTAVAVNGLTCYAVYEAARAAGFQVCSLDIENGGLNFSAETLLEALNAHPEIKIVMIQNTLGYPCNMAAIAKICRERELVLIEDLAHSMDAKYASGHEAGTMGDFTVLSMSQDKVVDGMSGGALVIRSPQFGAALPNITANFRRKSLGARLKDRLYPILTWKIRATHRSGLGKIFHTVLRRFHILPQPVQPQLSLKQRWPYHLPHLNAQAALQSIKQLPKLQRHRTAVAEIYFHTLNTRVLLNKNPESLVGATHLRFPIVVKNRPQLVTYLRKHGVHVSDIWYDAPFAPKKYMHLSDYREGTCPRAEKMSAQILNLPTHINISPAQAKKIAQLINDWLND